MTATAAPPLPMQYDPHVLTPCPGCSTPTQPSIYGRPASCLACTELEVGEPYEQIRDRATKRVQGVAKKKWRVGS